MSQFEYVETAIWSDPTFHGLSPQAKVIYFWSFTNPRCNLAGLYKTSWRMIAVETGLRPKAVETAMGALEAAHLVHYEDPLLWVRARVKYLHTHNASVARSISKDIARFDPAHLLVQAFLFTNKNADWLKLDLSDFRAPSSNPLLNGRVPNTAEKGAINGVV